MTTVARLRTGYSKCRLFENKPALEAPGTLDDTRRMRMGRVVAQTTMQQRIKDYTKRVCLKVLTTLEVPFLLRERCSERSVATRPAGAGLDEYRREDMVAVGCSESVSAQVWRPGQMRTLARRNVQVSGEKEPTKRANSFPVQIQNTIQSLSLIGKEHVSVALLPLE